jgi:hypothetical protein
MMTPVDSTADELIPVYVARKHYPAVSKFVVSLDEKSDTSIPETELQDGLLYNRWRPFEITTLRNKLRIESAALLLLELTCKEPGRRISFDELVQASGKSLEKVRADLAVLSRTIHAMFGQDRGWPIHWTQDSLGAYSYFASQDLADAWHAGK